MVRVLFAENHAIVRKAIEQVLASDPRIDLLGATSGFCDAVGEAVKSRPDILLIDIDTPLRDGLSASYLAARLTSIEARVLGMSFSNDEDARFFATGIGAAELLDKVKLGTELIPAIMKVASACDYSPLSIPAKRGDRNTQ